MSYIYLSGHCRCHGCIFFHKQHRQFFDLWFFSVVIRVCFKNNLLSFVPLLHNITSGTNWILSIIFIIGMLWYDSYNCHGVWPNGIWLIHMKLYCCIVHCNSFLQHGKIVYRAFITTGIKGKSNIRGGQWLSICKLHIITDFYSPGKTIVTAGILCSKVIFNSKVLGGTNQGTLDQWLMNMLSGSPSVSRIKTGFRF